MSRIEDLAKSYEKRLSLGWDKNLSGAEKIWFALYDKADERRLRARIEEFDLATKRQQHGWHLLDITSSFAEWMSAHEYRESYFESPDDLSNAALEEYQEFLSEKIKTALEEAGENDVVAVLGISVVFGFLRFSSVLQAIETAIKGRMLVFFPGSHDENNNYRLLEARDGWNYLAVPIRA